MKNKIYLTLLLSLLFCFFLYSCNQAEKPNQTDTRDSLSKADSSLSINSNENDTIASNVKTDSLKFKTNKEQQTVIYVYNFHVTNRCASCIAIEESTTLTLNRYFAKELKEGRIIRKILNVDDKKNNRISEKYEAFGSGLFVTRISKGKETTTDLTGDGFKYARNKQEKFIEILKTVITNYLK